MRSRSIWLAALLALAACGRPPAQAPAAPSPPEAVAAPGLHNVHRLAPGLLAGSQPEGAAGFAALRELGVRTVISVDGAQPDLPDAAAAGLRYVHLPVGYDGIPAGRGAEIARAIRDLPGPVYIHCHHGKHRCAAAAATAGVLAGVVDPAQVEGVLAAFQTGREYPGLWASALSARPAAASALDAASAAFPASSPPQDLVATMVAVDARMDALGAIRAAGWRAPPAQPDLDPAHEALQLRELLTEAGRTHPAAAWRDRLAPAIAAAAALETGLRAGDGADLLAGAHQALRQSCIDCHRQHRDRR